MYCILRGAEKEAWVVQLATGKRKRKGKFKNHSSRGINVQDSRKHPETWIQKCNNRSNHLTCTENGPGCSALNFCFA